MRTRELTGPATTNIPHLLPRTSDQILGPFPLGEPAKGGDLTQLPGRPAPAPAGARAIRLLTQREGRRSSSTAERCVELVAVHCNRDGARHGILRIVKIARESVGANARQRRGLRDADRSGRTLGAHAKGIASLPPKGRPASRAFCSSRRERNSTAATPRPVKARLAVGRKREADSHCRCQKTASDADRERCPSHARPLG